MLFACKIVEHRAQTAVYIIPRIRSNIVGIGQLSEIGVKTVVDRDVMSLYDG